MTIITVIVFLLILSILVLVHELGHFITAKILGIKVEEFGFGFPPKVFGIKRGETEYTINLLPIGGFVKLYGEDEAGAGKPSVKSQNKKIKDIDRAFFARPIWQRGLVVVAGVLMNFILAIILISYLYAVPGVPTVGDQILVSQVSKNSPAQVAGLKEGDQILSINGNKITSPSQVISETRKHLGEKIAIEIKDPEKGVQEFSITPRKTYPNGEGPMGVSIAQNVIVKKYPWYKAPILGTKEVIKDSILIVAGLGQVLTQVFTKAQVPAGVAGPIGIAQVTGTFVTLGFNAVLSFVALLSLNLGIINILPIPALDGGRFFFILIEAVTRRKVHPKFEAYAHAVGIAVLLILIALITAHDFYRLIKGLPIIPTQ